MCCSRIYKYKDTISFWTLLDDNVRNKSVKLPESSSVLQVVKTWTHNKNYPLVKLQIDGDDLIVKQVNIDARWYCRFSYGFLFFDRNTFAIYLLALTSVLVVSIRLQRACTHQRLGDTDNADFRCGVQHDGVARKQLGSQNSRIHFRVERHVDIGQPAPNRSYRSTTAIGVNSPALFGENVTREYFKTVTRGKSIRWHETHIWGAIIRFVLI